MKALISHWIPTAFCALISLYALFGPSGPDGFGWKPVFFAFLPICFFHVGATTLNLQRQIRDLRSQLEVSRGDADRETVES